MTEFSARTELYDWVVGKNSVEWLNFCQELSRMTEFAVRTQSYDWASARTRATNTHKRKTEPCSDHITSPKRGDRFCRLSWFYCMTREADQRRGLLPSTKDRTADRSSCHPAKLRSKGARRKVTIDEICHWRLEGMPSQLFDVPTELVGNARLSCSV